MNNRPVKILLYIILTLELLPDVFRENSYFNLALYGIRALGGLLAVLLFITSKRKSRSIYFLAAYMIYLLLITMVKSFSASNIVRFVSIYADIFIVAVFTEYLLQRDTRRLLKLLWVYAWIGLVINCLTVFLLRNGLYVKTNEMGVPFAYYFYGYDNSFIFRYIPSIFIFYVYEKKYYVIKYPIRTLLAMVLCFASLLYKQSIGSCLGMGAVFLGFLLLKLIPEKLTSVKTIWIGYLAVAALLTMGSLTDFGSKFISVVGKSQAMNMRAQMWTIALKAIPRNLLFGRGVLNTFAMRDIFMYAQLHNTLLTTLFWGGVLGIVLYTVFIFSLENDCLKKESEWDRKLIALLFLGLVIVSLLDGAELSYHIYLFYFFVANYDAVAGLEVSPSQKKRIVLGKRSAGKAAL